MTATTVYAQSQSESKQQTSQPPEEQKPKTGTRSIFNNQSRPANAPEHCASLAKVISGKGLPDYDLCDIVVYRQAPAITRNDGLVINNFSGIGHYIELASAARFKQYRSVPSQYYQSKHVSCFWRVGLT